MVTRRRVLHYVLLEENQIFSGTQKRTEIHNEKFHPECDLSPTRTRFPPQLVAERVRLMIQKLNGRKRNLLMKYKRSKEDYE